MSDNPNPRIRKPLYFSKDNPNKSRIEKNFWSSLEFHRKLDELGLRPELERRIKLRRKQMEAERLRKQQVHEEKVEITVFDRATGRSVKITKTHKYSGGCSSSSA